MFFGPVYPYLEFPLRSLSTLWSSLVVIGSYINRYFLFLDMIRPVFVTLSLINMNVYVHIGIWHIDLFMIIPRHFKKAINVLFIAY